MGKIKGEGEEEGAEEFRSDGVSQVIGQCRTIPAKRKQSWYKEMEAEEEEEEEEEEEMEFVEFIGSFRLKLFDWIHNEKYLLRRGGGGGGGGGGGWNSSSVE